MAARTFIVTSSMGGAGRTTVAVGLALALADAGQRTALADLATQRPWAHRYLGVDPDLERRGIAGLMRWAGDAKNARLVRDARDVRPFIVSISERLDLLPGLDEGAWHGSDKSPLRRQLLTNAATLDRALDVIVPEYDAIVIDASSDRYTAVGAAGYLFAARQRELGTAILVAPDNDPGDEADFWTQMCTWRHFAAGGLGALPVVAVGNRGCAQMASGSVPMVASISQTGNGLVAVVAARDALTLWVSDGSPRGAS